MREQMRRLLARLRNGRTSGDRMDVAEVEFVDRTEARLMLEERAMRYFGMTVDEFRVAWERGKFTADDEARATRATEVAALLPLVS